MGEGRAERGAAVRLEDLWKTFGDRIVAVRDVNLSVNPGEFITLLGPSGSGKTTTLMMIAGFVQPSYGEIFIGDAPVARLPAQKRNLGMVFQNYALFPHMTVTQNVAFPLEMRRVSRSEAQQRVQDALSMVQLSGFGDRYPRQLSGGQQQRVALARALVFDAHVLLMDEPLGALDKKLREHMQLEIKHIQKHLNVTVIYVTHDQEEALTMSDRIAVMNHGRIEQAGVPNELYDEPASPFVAGFIGESNFLRGIVRSVHPDGSIEVEQPGIGLFRAVSRVSMTAGDSVVAAIRPERLALATGDDAKSENRWSGRIVETIYVGDATKYKVAVGDQMLTVKQQNRDMVARLMVGDEVGLVWSPTNTKILTENVEEDITDGFMDE